MGDDAEHSVGRQEGFGDRYALVGRVVQRTLEPLLSGSLQGRLHKGENESRQPRRPFTEHRVSFVGHRAGADLFLLKRFFDLLQTGEEPHVVGELVHASRYSAERTNDLSIDLAGVGLARNRFDLLEPHLSGNVLLEPQDFSMVMAAEGQEARLRARGPFDAPEAQAREAMLDLVQVANEVVTPQRRSL